MGTDGTKRARPSGTGPGAGALPYASPAALRAALTDKIKAIVKADPTYSFGEVSRQFGYDRLLARLDWGSEPAEESWVLKGATSLLARLHTGGRHSLDIDLYRQTTDLRAAEQALRQAAAVDIGDYFTFDLRPATALTDATKGVRIPVVARLGPVWSEFHVDVVVGLTMTGQPEVVAPLTTIEIPGLLRPSYRVYPLVDHIADKLAATFELRTSAAGQPQGSSRVKDAVDLLLIARTQTVDAAALRAAIASETARRGLHMPTAYAVPDQRIWASAWHTVAGKAPLLASTSLTDALPTIKALLDPVLSGSRKTGTWHPSVAEWTDEQA